MFGVVSVVDCALSTPPTEFDRARETLCWPDRLLRPRHPHVNEAIGLAVGLKGLGEGLRRIGQGWAA